MSFFISDAMAQGAAPAASTTEGLLGFLPLIVIFILFYFLLIRPQVKRAKEHRNMVDALSKNEEIVTSGGLAGRITKMDESFITLEISDGVEVKVQKTAVASLLPKGTLKGS